uniref:RAB, member RAS oncogene family-like 2 n=1 Tax=Mus musculus TaxID=10090 RepID=E9Q473_MOUSE
MAGDRNRHCELEQEKYDTHENVKIICLGDSAVGKSNRHTDDSKEFQFCQEVLPAPVLCLGC